MSNLVFQNRCKIYYEKEKDEKESKLASKKTMENVLRNKESSIIFHAKFHPIADENDNKRTGRDNLDKYD